MRKIIFSVDDNDTNLAKIESALEEKYDVITLSSGELMFDAIENIMPDLILLDLRMPNMDGFEAIQLLKANPNYATIPVIFLTGTIDVDIEAKGFEMGAVDFIHKPFSNQVLLNRVGLQINMNELLKEKTAELNDNYNQLILILSDIVESRDENTGDHIGRTVKYVRILATALLERNIYTEDLADWDLEVIPSCSILHDIGKVGISDIILNKPGKLTDEEFEIMKEHVNIGSDLINRTISRTGGNLFLKAADMFVKYHHERWDGSGYPAKLAGENIPIHGRLMAIADVYDALATARPYKKAFPHEKAVEMILNESGKHFDPVMIKVFAEISGQFKKIHEENYHENI
ncbi:MAG: response regulator [Firmicutes bacterium]|nr:response regulator [Bacillota bacterium]